ncbi:MAG: GIY-YIG nuclease family protein [Phycisphaerae bacterium]
MNDWPAAGVYQLWMRVTRDIVLTVGRLGRCPLPAGSYVYVGRASRALRARVLRHAFGSKRKHWHIDFVLAHPEARIERIVLASQDPEQECRISQKVGEHASCTIPGFGASDCANGCDTHFWRI